MSLILSPGLAAAETGRRRDAVRGVALLVVIAVVGLFIVKWQPYFLRAFSAAEHHSLGASIVTGAAAAPPAASLDAAWQYARGYFLSVWQAMVLGLLLAATIESSLPRNAVARVLGSSAFRSSALGGLMSLPAMMCTCCATPVAIGLRRNGASLGAATAFLLGNPTLNPAVLVFITFTLGWQWAILRLLLGSLLVFGGAAAAARFGATLPPPDVAEAPLDTSSTRTWGARWLRSLARLVIQLIPEYVVVVGLLGFARVFLFPTASAELASQAVVLVGLALAGTLFVIPTAGEIPIVQTMQAFGMGAGPAGVLLLTLAPISLPSLLMAGRAFPWRVLVLLAGLTAVIGLAAGVLAIALQL